MPEGEEKNQAIIDDIDFSGLIQKSASEKKEEVDDFEEKKEVVSEEVKEEVREEVKEEQETKTEEQKEEKEVEVPDDFFTETEEKEEQKETSTILNFDELAKEFGIEEEIKDQKEFVQKIKETINKSKSDVDLSKFDPQAQKLIEHLNNKNGDLTTFFENKLITSMNNILQMDSESKFRTVRYQELYAELKDEEKAVEKLEEEVEEMSKGELKTKAEEINQQAIEIRKKEIDSLIARQDQQIVEKQEKTVQERKQEKQNLINYISKQESFFGLKLTQEAKSAIIKDLDRGNFDEMVNATPEASKFYAYMIAKYGKKLSERISNAVKESGREAFNKAQDTHFKALHKTEVKGKTPTGHSKSAEGEKRGFENWSDSKLFGD